MKLFGIFAFCETIQVKSFAQRAFLKKSFKLLGMLGEGGAQVFVTARIFAHHNGFYIIKYAFGIFAAQRKVFVAHKGKSAFKPFYIPVKLFYRFFRIFPLLFPYKLFDFFCKFVAAAEQLGVWGYSYFVYVVGAALSFRFKIGHSVYFVVPELYSHGFIAVYGENVQNGTAHRYLTAPFHRVKACKSRCRKLFHKSWQVVLRAFFQGHRIFPDLFFGQCELYGGVGGTYRHGYTSLGETVQNLYSFSCVFSRHCLRVSQCHILGGKQESGFSAA